MNPRLSVTLLCSLMMISEAALAFRCGNKIVREGLTESEVIALCGEPAEKEDLGLRLVPYIDRHRQGGLSGTRNIDGYFVVEVRVTLFIYNFGPRKLMQRLKFENSTLVNIESAGYGYRSNPG